MDRRGLCANGSRHTTSTKPQDSELNSVDTKELDDMITYCKTQVDQIMEQSDKHERLGAKVVATDENGGKRDVYTDNRTSMRKTWPELEQQVAQYQYNGDDWISAAKEAAKLANMEIDWNIYDAETNDMATKIHNNQCMVN